MAIALGIIFASTFTREIGRQLSKKERFFPFFSLSVMTACFCERYISPFSKHSFVCIPFGGAVTLALYLSSSMA